MQVVLDLVDFSDFFIFRFFKGEYGGVQVVLDVLLLVFHYLEVLHPKQLVEGVVAIGQLFAEKLEVAYQASESVKVEPVPQAHLADVMPVPLL